MKRLISNYIDKKFYKLGWVKREENKYIIAYEKYIKNHFMCSCLLHSNRTWLDDKRHHYS